MGQVSRLDPRICQARVDWSSMVRLPARFSHLVVSAGAGHWFAGRHLDATGPGALPEQAMLWPGFAKNDSSAQVMNSATLGQLPQVPMHAMTYFCRLARHLDEERSVVLTPHHLNLRLINASVDAVGPTDEVRRACCHPLQGLCCLKDQGIRGVVMAMFAHSSGNQAGRGGMGDVLAGVIVTFGPSLVFDAASAGLAYRLDALGSLEKRRDCQMVQSLKFWKR